MSGAVASLHGMVVLSEPLLDAGRKPMVAHPLEEWACASVAESVYSYSVDATTLAEVEYRGISGDVHSVGGSGLQITLPWRRAKEWC